MPKRMLLILLVGCVFTGALWAADDPFVGKWKLNPSKSKVTEEMKVESAGANTYAFDVGAGPETVVVDGTDQPGYGGTTLSVTVLGQDSWRVVRKKDGHTLLTADWKLSPDGNTLRDDYTEFAANGSSSNVKYVFERTAGKAGFAGTWESPSQPMSTFVLEVRAYEGDGFSFIMPSGVTRSVKFDGKDYPVEGPNVPQGFVSSGRRVNEQTLQLTDKISGKTIDTAQIELSRDLKTLTRTVQMPGRSKPNIFVFDRQ